MRLVSHSPPSPPRDWDAELAATAPALPALPTLRWMLLPALLLWCWAVGALLAMLSEGP